MCKLNPELTACPMVWKMMIAAIIVSRCHILLNILIITISYAFAHFYSLFRCPMRAVGMMTMIIFIF